MTIYVHVVDYQIQHNLAPSYHANLSQTLLCSPCSITLASMFSPNIQAHFHLRPTACAIRHFTLELHAPFLCLLRCRLLRQPDMITPPKIKMPLNQSLCTCCFIFFIPLAVSWHQNTSCNNTTDFSSSPALPSDQTCRSRALSLYGSASTRVHKM